MKLYLIRHGDPNYKDNCLTPLGHVQAEALAERMTEINPTRLYTSTYGRARETAEHTANKLGMPITELDFIHEINTTRPDMDGKENYRDYTAWVGTEKMAAEGIDLRNCDWDNSLLWNGNRIKPDNERVVAGFDAWLETLGYKREGLYYRVVEKDRELRPMVFAHGGSITCVLAHVFGLHPLFFVNFLRINCTGITVLEFEGETGTLCCPRLTALNDHSHIIGLTVPGGGNDPRA
ncbi:MAG: histidine phosphatase family protein [Clostridia bacterium]|nr:histidine phosphatase family protein [Clostridia bacterium]